MNPNPTILLVNGAWHTPAVMQPLRQVLQDRGYESVCPALPTMGDAEASEFKDKTFFDDVQVIRETVAQLVDEGKDVLVVAHSYGGQVTSEAVRHEFSKTARSEANKSGGVVGLVYVCAFLIPEGKVGTVYFALPRFPPPLYLVPHPFKGYSSIRNGAETFYNDLPEADAQRWEAELVRATLLGHAKPTTYAAQRHHRILYIHATKDKAIVPELQKYMVRKNREVGVVVDKEVELDSGHSPFLSMPAQLADEMLAFLAE